jgi:hypothetical protein
MPMTRVIVAHRTTTLAMANRVLHLGNGKSTADDLKRSAVNATCTLPQLLHVSLRIAGIVNVRGQAGPRESQHPSASASVLVETCRQTRASYRLLRSTH